MLTFYAKGFAIFNEVYITGEFASVKAFCKLNGLQLANHAKTTIVKDDCSYRKLVACNGKQFGTGHFETTVTTEADYSTIRTSKLCAHSCRQAKAHSTQATGSNPLSCKLDTQMLSCPHLMLANVSSNDVIFIFNYRVQCFEEFRCFLVTKVFIHAGPAFNTFPPST